MKFEQNISSYTVGTEEGENLSYEHHTCPKKKKKAN